MQANPLFTTTNRGHAVLVAKQRRAAPHKQINVIGPNPVRLVLSIARRMDVSEIGGPALLHSLGSWVGGIRNPGRTKKFFS